MLSTIFGLLSTGYNTGPQYPGARMPPELLIDIFSWLDSGIDGLACAQVCRQWRSVIHGSDAVIFKSVAKKLSPVEGFVQPNPEYRYRVAPGLGPWLNCCAVYSIVTYNLTQKKAKPLDINTQRTADIGELFVNLFPKGFGESSLTMTLGPDPGHYPLTHQPTIFVPARSNGDLDIDQKHILYEIDPINRSFRIHRNKSERHHFDRLGCISRIERHLPQEVSYTFPPLSSLGALRSKKYIIGVSADQSPDNNIRICGREIDTDVTFDKYIPLPPSQCMHLGFCRSNMMGLFSRETRQVYIVKLPEVKIIATKPITLSMSFGAYTNRLKLFDSHLLAFDIRNSTLMACSIGDILNPAATELPWTTILKVKLGKNIKDPVPLNIKCSDRFICMTFAESLSLVHLVVYDMARRSCKIYEHNYRQPHNTRRHWDYSYGSARDAASSDLIWAVNGEGVVTHITQSAVEVMACGLKANEIEIGLDLDFIICEPHVERRDITQG